MFKQAAAVGLVAGVLAGSAIAQQDRVPTGIPHLDHVFLIMMENHGYQQVINNPNEPYLNSLISTRQVNLATNYFAVGTSEPDQLSGNCRRIQFRRPQR